VSIGNFVHSYPHGPIHQVAITEQYSLWEHGKDLKDPTKFLSRWDEVKGSWIEPSEERTTRVHDEDVNIDDNIMETYTKFTEERWKPRAVIDELYRNIFVMEKKWWLKICRYVQSWDLP